MKVHFDDFNFKCSFTILECFSSFHIKSDLMESHRKLFLTVLSIE